MAPTALSLSSSRVQTLPPLTAAEVRGLLLKLSEAVEEKEGEQGAAKRRVHEWLDADASRLRTLVQLTGGNPRTAVLLFHLVLDGLKGGAREYLEQLLDQVTPTTKAESMNCRRRPNRFLTQSRSIGIP